MSTLGIYVLCSLFGTSFLKEMFYLNIEKIMQMFYENNKQAQAK